MRMKHINKLTERDISRLRLSKARLKTVHFTKSPAESAHIKADGGRLVKEPIELD